MPVSRIKFHILYIKETVLQMLKIISQLYFYSKMIAEHVFISYSQIP